MKCRYCGADLLNNTNFCVRCGKKNDDTTTTSDIELAKVNWKVEVVLSHTKPLKYEPVEVFLDGVDQSKVDKT